MLTSQQLNENDLAILKGCVRIADLEGGAHRHIVEAVVISNVAAGQDIITQGMAGGAFYILLDGGVEVIKRTESGTEAKVAQLQPGAYFGEQALLGNASGRAAATVRAVSECRLAIVPAAVFLEHIAADKNNRAVFDQTILGRCPPLDGLEESVKQKVLQASKTSTFEARADVITQDTVGDSFYVLLEGFVEVIKREENGNEIKLVELGPGAYFGEQALLGNAFGRRSATVRAKVPCRVAAIPAEVFAKQIASSDRNKERFEKDASRYVYEQISKSLDSFVSSELDETSGGVQRLTYKTGETLVNEGDPSDAAFLILSGVALVLKRTGEQHREMARMGSGQVFGELGVLKGQPRAATVMAEAEMEVLKIDAESFVKWHKAHPKVSGFFDSLTQVYTLSEGRRLSLFMGNVGGEPAVTSIVGAANDGVVSTRILNQGVVVFTNAQANAIEGERSSLTFSNDKFKRELRIIVKERKQDKIHRCIVYAVSADGIESDLGTLYQHVLKLEEVQPAALRRFEKTGFLGANAGKAERLCPCLGLGSAEISESAKELGCQFETLQANIGVGSICGGCERTVRTFLEQGAPAAQPEIQPATMAAEANPANAERRAPDVADFPPDLLTKEEKQLAALLARGMGPDLHSVTREQMAVRLRATGVRDMNFFIDMLFPGVFTKYARATYATLAVAVSRGVGFGPWRQEALAPKSPAAQMAHKAVLGIYWLGRKGVVAALAMAAGISMFAAPDSAGPYWVAFLGALPLAYGALSLRPSGQFLRTLITAGPARYYRALYTAFGKEQNIGVLKMLPVGPPTLVVRDERLVDYILQNPHIYARLPVAGYPPFAEHSVLGGGSSGVWLGYRVLFEEYFAEGYHEDLDQIREIVRERIQMWQGRESIDLLKEIYRINVEIRARVFFQTTFDCFDDHAAIDFAGIVDRVLSPQVLLVNGTSNGEVDVLRQRVLEAVKGSKRKNSIGGIILDAWQAGDLNEREACENGVLYVLAQAPTMGVFWTLYRAARDGRQSALRESRKEIVKSIKEDLRLHAPVTSMFRREVQRDDRLGDFPVTKGDLIILCPMYIHTSEKQWTDPFRYDPNRWTSATGDGKEIVEPKTDPADANARPRPVAEGVGTARYLPFGGGGQACQGRWFAADEMLIVVEEILKNYDLEVLDDGGLLAKPLSEQVTFHVYNRPFNDVRMKPVRR